MQKDDEYINRLILRFTGQNNPSIGKCLHVLDVFRKNLVKQGGSKRSLNNACMGKCLHVLDVFGKIKDTGGIIPPATELRKHGIKFKRSGTDSLTDISFASGVLSLPMIVVDDTTEPTFLNLIAFERSRVGAGAEVTSYICLMDSLIDKEQDVVLLCNKGIIKNYLESVDVATKLFNSLAKDLMLDSESSINDVITKVRVYCERRWHKWRANLKHTYFRNPWVILSLIAAFVLFVLTIIQTVYAGLSYKK